MSAADPSAALATYLRSTSLSDIVDGRIWRPELPDGEDVSMPRGAVVIRRAGGYSLFGASNVPVGDPRLDLFCYGETWLDAENVAGAVVPALRSLRQSTWRWTDANGSQAARLYWARISAGPNPFDNPETNWPCALVTAQVAFCELALS